jgi:hypothetical protein
VPAWACCLLALVLAPALHSISLNHYYLQMLGVTAGVGLFLYFVESLRKETWPPGQDALGLTLFGGASLACYWGALPGVGVLALSYLPIRAASRWGGCVERPRRLEWVLCGLLALALGPNLLATVGGAVGYVRRAGADPATTAAHLGSPVASLQEALGPLLGVAWGERGDKGTRSRFAPC